MLNVCIFQQGVGSIICREGIPDCWREYLIHKLILTHPLLQGYESMHKEDVDVVHDLRKRYRFYLGQGIPDPWKSYPIIENHGIRSSRRLRAKIGREILRLLHSGSGRDPYRKDSCFCCEKKYLFECPDKDAKGRYALNCTCEDCHGKNANACREHCKCVQTLQNWALESTELVKGQEGRRGKKCLGSNTSSLRYTPDNKDATRPRNYRKVNTSSSDSESYENPLCIPKRHSKARPEENCFCPYTTNIAVEKFLNKNSIEKKSSELMKPFEKKASKEIQTKIQPEQDSKGIQTENSLTKIQSKSGDKCPQCNPPKCKAAKGQVKGSQTGQQTSTLCFPHSLFSHPSYVHPCSCGSTFVIHKFRDNQGKSKNKKEDAKKTDTQKREVSNVDLNNHQNKGQQDVSSIRDGKKGDPETHGSYKSYCETRPKPFDHLKYLTDSKFQSHLRPRHHLSRPHSMLFSQYQTPYMISKSFYDREPLVEFGTPEKFKPEEWNQLHVRTQPSTEKYEEFCSNENQSVNFGKNENWGFRSCSGDQATRTKAKQEAPTKVQYFKQMTDSDDSRTYGLIISNTQSRKAARKRKRLMANRKRRKKLVGTRNCTSNPPCPKVNKIIQVDMSREDANVNDHENHQNSNRLPYNPSGNSVGSPKDEISTGCSRFSRVVNSNLEKMERESSKKFYDESYAPGSQKPPLTPDRHCGGVFEKISRKSRAPWSLNTLKTMVDELLAEKKFEDS